ncbi:MAG: DUF1878 family protein [Bacillota bacterium]|nr:DUF1878 family protein [Bacillota bacterium]
MDEHDLINRISLLEYHQKLLLRLISNPSLSFDRLIIEKGISEKVVNQFLVKCDELSMKMTEQKAEGFVYFYPLFSEFLSSLPAGVEGKEVINACMNQNVFDPLMHEFKNYLNP